MNLRTLKTKYIMKKLLLASMFVGAIAFTACEQKNDGPKDVAEEQNENKLPDNMEDDAEFAVDAAEGGMLEVKLGELAQTNASAPAVKEFGQMMVTDHSAAGEKLKAVATSNNITLPAALSQDKQKMYDDLAAKKGADFDKAYVDMMVDDHSTTIDKFQKEANDGKNADLKAFAANTIPVLQGHKQKIDAIKESMK